MAGVFNTKANQRNLKHIHKGRHLTIRLKPGFNIVDDDIWNGVKKSEYVLDLIDDGILKCGSEEDDKELDGGKAEIAVTKSRAVNASTGVPTAADDKKKTKKAKKKASK